MIIGRGNIASIIPDREGFIFFACGESNRYDLTHERAEKELKRLLKCDRDKMLVYFSGLNLYYPDVQGRTDYLKHKMWMEAIVRYGFPNYCIMRLGTITWGDNPNSLINYIRRELKEKGECSVRPGYRYINTKEEIQHWINLIPTRGKHEMNITGRMLWVPDLVEMIKKGEI